MFDVIDVKTGTLLASQRVSGMFQFFLSDDIVTKYRETADGTPVIDILRVRLNR